jgi:hypothetical protein
MQPADACQTPSAGQWGSYTKNRRSVRAFLGARELRRFCFWFERGLDLLSRDFGEVFLLPIYLGALGVEFV